MDDWPAMNDWDFEKLGTRLFRGIKVDVLDDLSSYHQWNECRMTMAASLRNPPKVHMTDFHEVYPELMNDVNISQLFNDKDDFLEIVDSDIRPPQLSFQMEPKRSGTHWRVEVLNGSLWSALVQGHKRWGLYHPDVFFPPGVVHNKYSIQNDQSSDPFTWWAYTQPHLHADRQPLECVQKPGEMLYIPSGWWWSYINLDDSIGLQEYFGKYEIDEGDDETKEDVRVIPVIATQ
ncbi:hypothetical protein QZH41_016621 [Actinostola sp. cb2023]|nr:hypothetical protein QZH41_016621 [Actinostola sp. cb2023]